MKSDSALVRPLDALSQFLKTEAASGVLLLLAAVAALVLANSGLSRAFEDAVHLPFTLGAGTLAIGTTFQHAVNDGLMAIFFLVVGLEIKREFLTGELSGKGAALVPIAAACGGAAVPALLYSAWNAGGPTSHGWGIPMATDIAFAVGILALVGSRVPPAFKVFLTALAVVDDLIAVAVIAIFYAGGLDFRALALVAAAFAALLGLNRARVRVLTPYLVIGVVMWAAMAKSGVHPTVAGVLLAFTLPAEGGDAAPLRRLERALHPWVAFLIMPVFALVNAGVTLKPGFLSSLPGSPLAVGILVGLFAGKQIGIFGTVSVLAWFGVGNLPADRRNRRTLWGISLLGGIGFTMSLFVSGLAFGGEAHFEDTAKAAILAGSLLSGIAGALVLVLVPGKPVAASPAPG
jgi:NhaA family Na+:H+ antiporter